MRPAILISGVIFSVFIAFVLGIYVGVQAAPGQGIQGPIAAGAETEPRTAETTVRGSEQPAGGTTQTLLDSANRSVAASVTTAPPDAAPSTEARQAREGGGGNWIDQAVAKLRGVSENLQNAFDPVEQAAERLGVAETIPARAAPAPPAAPLYAIQTSHRLSPAEAGALANRLNAGRFAARVIPVARWVSQSALAPADRDAFVRIGNFPDRDSARRAARLIQQDFRLTLDIVRISTSQTAAAEPAGSRDG